MTIHTTPVAALPTLDFSRFAGGADERAAFVRELTSVLHDHGFFYLTGHGVPQDLIDEVLSVSKRFFALPEAEKLAIEMVRSPHFRGYNRAGFERTRGQQDWREQLDINTEGTAVTAGPDAPWNRLLGPNQWPEALPELQFILLRYQAEVTRVGIDLLKAIACRSASPRTRSPKSTSRPPRSSSRSSAIPAATRRRATRASGRTRTAASSPCSCRTRCPASGCRRRAASGSTCRRSRARSSINTASFWNWPPTVSCAPTCMR